MSHYSNSLRSPLADELLGKTIPVLSGQGHLILADYLGSDASVVRGARCSYGELIKSLQEDERLIRFLMRHSHTSPFEQVSFLFHLRLPFFLSYEFTRCRSSKSQIVWPKGELDFWIPERMKKHGLDDLHKETRAFIEKIRLAGEDSRTLLAFSNGTFLIDLIWQIDLHNLFQFLRKRKESCSSELGEFLEVLIRFVQAVAPCSFSAFGNYFLRGQLINREEFQKISKNLPSLSRKEIEEEAIAIGMAPGEIQEFFKKFSSSKEFS